MSEKQLPYITWLNSPHWSTNIILGTEGQRYKFSANWNSRIESWVIDIALDNQVVIQGIKLVLGVDLLASILIDIKLDCLLIVDTEIEHLDKITFKNMINGEAKLFHITSEV